MAILFVDDESSALRFISASVQRAGFEVLLADGGAMRRSVQVDEHLKIGFDRAGEAWAEAPAGEKPDTLYLGR